MRCSRRRKVAKFQVGLIYSSYTTADLFVAAAGKIDPLGEEEESQEKTNSQRCGNVGVFLARLDSPRGRKSFDSKYAEKHEIREGGVKVP
jgi:hypothetical protein